MNPGPGSKRRTAWALALGVALQAALSAAHAEVNVRGAAIANAGAANGVAACASCHGAKGEGNAAAGFPRLAGLEKTYLVAQLHSFADGTRKNPVMQPIAKALDASQLAAVTAHYSKLAAPPAAAVPREETASPAQPGAWLAQRGRWDAGLPACIQCHGPGGAGVGTAFPPLRGQSTAYIANQLHGFKQGSRPPGPMKLMAVVAAKLSDDDIAAVSKYYGAQAEEAGPQTTEERK